MEGSLEINFVCGGPANRLYGHAKGNEEWTPADDIQDQSANRINKADMFLQDCDNAG